MAKIVDDIYVNITDDIEKVQKKPTMYISHTGQQAAEHLLKEITNNVIDEHKNPNSVSDGYCAIYYDCDTQTITVSDHGRGIPFEELENSCTILQSGTKMDRANGDTAGENGVGLTATNALSELFEITSTRNGQSKMIRFRDGKKVDERIINVRSKDKHGLTVTFKPSAFLLGDDVSLPIESFQDWLQKQSFFLDPTIKITFSVDHLPGKADVVTKVYKNTEGIGGFLPYVSPDADFMAKPITLENKMQKVETGIPVFVTDAKGATHRDLVDMDRTIQIEFSFNYTTADDQPRIYAFCNDIENTEGGYHQDAVVSAITTELLKIYKENQKKGDKVAVSSKDVMTGLRLVLNLRTDYSTKFEQQTKKKLGNAELLAPIKSMARDSLSEFFKLQENRKYVVKLCELLRENAKIRTENTEKRSKIKKESPTMLGSKLILGYTPANLVGKNTKGEELELYIVEGKSAGGLVRQARYNNDIQGVLATRGKPTNVYGISSKQLAASSKKTSKADSTARDSFIIILLDDILQCGYGDHYDESRLVYKKIILASDADVDGEHISGLYLADIYKHAPQLIEHGYVYRSVSPLYRIETKKKSGIDPNAYLYNRSEIFTRMSEVATANLMIRFDGEKTCVGPNNMRRFIHTNREYYEILMDLFDTYRINPDVTEYIIMHYDTFKKKGVMEKLDPELHYNAKNESVSGGYRGKFTNIVFEKTVNDKLNQLIKIFQTGNNGIGSYHLYRKKSTGDTEYLGYQTIGQIMKVVYSYEVTISSRYKGLGEMNASEMQTLVMNPDYRVLLRFSIHDADATRQNFDHLFLEKFANVRKELVKNANVSPDDIDN